MIINKVRSQEFAMGGLFWKLESTLNGGFSVKIRLRRFFCQNQEISKKKVFAEIQSFFQEKNNSTFWSKLQRWSPRGHILKSFALASKPQVLGLGLEALGPRKLPCPRLEDSTIFEPLKFCWKTP